MRQSMSAMMIASLLACATLSSLAIAGFWKIGAMNAPTAVARR
jgi:hypothetical protein